MDGTADEQMAVNNLSRRYNQPFDNLVDRYCVMGTPDQCLEKIQSFMEAGMRNLVFSFTCPADQTPAQLTRCAEELLPRLRSL